VKGADWKGAAPAFLMGSALGIVFMVAAGLLLYGGPGFVPALAAVLAVIFASLGVGLAAPPPAPGGSPGVEVVRRRWLLALLALTLAAAFSAGWEIFRGFGVHGATQTLGLAFLAALPAYTGGRVLSALQHLAREQGESGPALPAFVGAAAGVLALAHVLFPLLSPTAVILTCLLSVSAGALLHGLALDEGVRVDPFPGWEAGPGRLAAERWVRPASRSIRVAIREDGRLRALRDRDGSPVFPEERALEAGSVRWGSVPRRVVALGLGAAAATGRLGGPEGLEDLTVVDPAAEWVLGLLGTTGWPTARSRRAHVEDPLRFLQRGAGPLPAGGADWVVVDALALAATPAAAGLPPGALLRIHELLAPRGVLAILPLEEGSGARSLMERFGRVGSVFSRAALYLGPQGGREMEPLPPGRAWPRHPLSPGARRGFLVAADGSEAPWPESVEGFLRVSVGE
jgi:hypothetical protein